jgi:hypothetical protein
MDVENFSKKTKEVIDNAKNLIDEAKRNVCLMVYNEIILPHVKEYKVSIKWRMGGVLFLDQYGEELDDYDRRVKLLEEKLEEVLDGIDIINNGYHNLLWWVLCEQPGECVNHLGKTVEWDDESLNPSTYGRKKCFKDLEKGDYLYIVDYNGGDIDKIVVEETFLDDEGMLQVIPMNKGYTTGIFVPTHARDNNIFANYAAAEKSLQTLFDYLQNYWEFPFRPEDPAEYIAQVLS